MNQHHAPMEGAAHTDKVKRLVGTAILAAIVVVLQLLGSYLKIGGLPISLVLVPIVIGAAVYGAGTGAFLGFVFSIVVAIAAITGADQFSVVLWTINPAMTLLVIFAKGILAGWIAGLLYRALCKKSVFGAVLSAAAICPIVNTGVFCAGMLLFFEERLVQLAGGTNLLAYTLLTLAGVNFLVELGINILLGPAIVRILKAVRLA